MIVGPKKSLYVIFALSFFYFLLILNRWFFTDAGFASFARTWQYHVSYFDFGFLRRALVGTIFSLSGLNNLFSNDYVYAYVAYTLQTALLYLLILNVFRGRRISNIYVIFLVFLSPAFLLQLGYTSHSQDVALLIVCALIIFWSKGVTSFVLLLVSGLLIHEIFLVFVPFLVVMRFLVVDADKNVTFVPRYSLAVLSALAVIISLLAIFHFGRLDLDRNVYETLMAERMPFAAYNNFYWSGYYELTGSLRQNIADTFLGFSEKSPAAFLYLIFPLLYLFLLSRLCIGLLKVHGLNRDSAWLLYATLILPLCLGVAGSDVYRWIGMSCSLCILLLIHINPILPTRPTATMKVLAAFSFLAPLGGFPLERPFPLHQFILEWAF